MTKAVSATPTLPLSLDGVGINVGSSVRCVPEGQSCVKTQSLTTTRGHDIIVVVAETYSQSNISSLFDTAGLSFTQRLDFTHERYYSLSRLWEFYAIASAPLKSDNITAIVDVCCVTLLMQVFAVSGANTRAIFDKNPSIPAACSDSDCGDCVAYIETTACSVSIQTSTIDFVIAATAINDAGPCGLGYPRGVVPGFTNISNQFNRFEVDYSITTTPQRDIVFKCGATDATAIFVDAIAFRGAFGT